MSLVLILLLGVLLGFIITRYVPTSEIKQLRRIISCYKMDYKYKQSKKPKEIEAMKELTSKDLLEYIKYKRR